MRVMLDGENHVYRMVRALPLSMPTQWKLVFSSDVSTLQDFLPLFVDVLDLLPFPESLAQVMLQY